LLKVIQPMLSSISAIMKGVDDAKFTLGMVASLDLRWFRKSLC
jgi:hypothetical protein